MAGSNITPLHAGAEGRGQLTRCRGSASAKDYPERELLVPSKRKLCISKGL